MLKTNPKEFKKVDIEKGCEGTKIYEFRLKFLIPKNQNLAHWINALMLGQENGSRNSRTQRQDTMLTKSRQVSILTHGSVFPAIKRHSSYKEMN